MRRIRGISVRVSKHIIAKPNEHKKYTYVDATAIDRRSKLLPGEVSCPVRGNEKSADAIVAVCNEPSER